MEPGGDRSSSLGSRHFLWHAGDAMLPVPIRTVAGEMMLQGEGGPALLRAPAVHGEPVTRRRFQRPYGGTSTRGSLARAGGNLGVSGTLLLFSRWELFAGNSCWMQTPRRRAPGSGCCSKQ